MQERCQTYGDCDRMWTGYTLWIIVGTLAVLQTTRTLFTNKLKIFSLQKSWKGLVNFKPPKSAFRSFNSFRVLAMIWIITYHIMYISQGGIASKNKEWMYNVYQYDWMFHLMDRGDLAVDTFFTMGGFLAMTILTKKMRRSGGNLQLANNERKRIASSKD